MRRYAPVISLVGSAAVVLAVTLDAEQRGRGRNQQGAAVTFVLTDGSRVGGEIASMSDASPEMPMGELNLESTGREERSFGLEMVAVIDYVGGDPAVEELRALPERGQLLALKNGTRTIGRIEDLRNGQLRWRGASGDLEVYPVGQIARVYLDAAASRRVFEFDPRARAAAPRGGPAEDGSILVVANRQWTDTGIQVQGGQRFRFVVTGEVRFGRGENQMAPPDGNPILRDRRFPVPALPVGGLIGRVNQEPPFPIGSAPQAITLGQGGRLMLGVNDTSFDDNSGFFRVVVTRVR